MPPIQLDTIADYMRDVAAELIEPRFQKLSKEEIDTKTGPNDLVTIADIEAEEKLTVILNDALPGSYVVGEEAVSREEVSTSALATEEGYVWVIDPVDGTNNFAHGKPVFGTMISLNKSGETVAGWIYDIPNKRMAMAEKGSGVEINGARKQYPQMEGDIKEARGFLSSKFFPPKMRETLKPIIDEKFGETTPHMCCAHEYLDILDGKAVFSLYSRIKPWDHLAGAMMFQEAGSYSRKWDGSLYKPGDEIGGLINTPSEEVWIEIYDSLLKDQLNK